MSHCPQCGTQSSPGARFCRSCGTTLAESPSRPLPPRDLRGVPPSADWLSLDDILYTRDKRFGGLGALLVFFGAFSPWVSSSGLGGWVRSLIGSSPANSAQTWLVALAAVAVAVFLFRQRSGSIVMVIGIVLASWTVLFAITTLSGHSSPSWGILLTLAGSGLLAYSGHLTNEYERV